MALNDVIDWMIHDILVQDCGEGSAWDTCALPSWQLAHPGEALRADQGQSGGGGGQQGAHTSPSQGYHCDEEAGVWGARARKAKEEEKERAKRTKSPVLQEKEEEKVW